jgi:hypothetical protein
MNGENIRARFEILILPLMNEAYNLYGSLADGKSGGCRGHGSGIVSSGIQVFRQFSSPNARSLILVPYKFVGLVSSPRWILRPGAEEAIRTTIAAIGTTNGRSPETIPDWNLGNETRTVSLPNSEKVNGNTHREHL